MPQSSNALVRDETGDADPVRASRVDARLDRSTGIVDVGVDVPLAVATDDEDRVAQLRQPGPERGDALLLLHGEQVHDLVLGAVRFVGGSHVGVQGPGHEQGFRGGAEPAPPVRGREPEDDAAVITGSQPLEALQHEHQTGSPGVHDSRARQHRRCSGVRSRASWAAARTRAATAYRPSSTASPETAATALDTDSMVPSLGSVTPCHARSSARTSPAARPAASMTSAPERASARPRTSWLRMTRSCPGRSTTGCPRTS